MKTGTRLPIAAMLLATPLAAIADTIPHIEEFAYALGGGAIGGFLGALLACWLCVRRREAKGGSGPNKG
jgi:hypothetical protein